MHYRTARFGETRNGLLAGELCKRFISFVIRYLGLTYKLRNAAIGGYLHMDKKICWNLVLNRYIFGYINSTLRLICSRV